MVRKLFVNLPVRDLERSKTFFAALGFSFNPQFTDQNAACMVVGPENHVMLLTEPFFAGFTPRPVADARQVSEVLVAFDCASRAEVDEMLARALAAGGSEPRPRATTASCISAPSRTPTGTCGNRSGWTRRMCSREAAAG